MSGSSRQHAHQRWGARVYPPRKVGAFATLAALLVGAGCDRHADEVADFDPSDRRVQVEIAPRTPHLATFSCVDQCHHELEPDATPRELTEFHTFRPVAHGPAINWCSFCHAIDDIDRLHRFDGTPLDFDESHLLCAQCHGDKHRDWEQGIHGIQTGEWNGVQTRVSCPFCHDPHVPGIPRVEALPAPWRPGRSHGNQHD